MMAITTKTDHGYAWVVLGCSTVLLFIAVMLSTGVAGIMLIVMIDYYQSASKASLALVSGIQFAAGGIAGFTLAPVAKNRGTKVLIVGGAIISSCGYVLSAFVSTVLGLYLTYGVMVGFGSVGILIGATVAVQTYFDKRKATAFGIMLFFSNLGVFIGPLLAIYITRHYSLQGAFILLGGIQLQCVWIGLLFRPVVRHKASQPSSATKHKKTCSQIWLTCQPFKNRPYILYFIAMYLMFCGYFFPFAFLPMRAVYLGYGEYHAGMFIAFTALIMGFVQLIAGWVSDKIRQYRLYVCGVAISVAGLATLLSYFFPTFGYLLAYTIVFGCANGISAVLYNVLPVDIWGPKVIEPFTGHVYICSGLATLTMAASSGYIIDKVGNPWAPGILCGIFQIISGMLVCLTKCLVRNDDEQATKNMGQS